MSDIVEEVRRAAEEVILDNSPDVKMRELWDAIITLVIHAAARNARSAADGSSVMDKATEAIVAMERLRDRIPRDEK